MNTKPLSEWTLAEVKAECEKYAMCSPECRAYNDKLERAIACRARFAPSAWDLSEPPRWTEQDKEDARALKRLIANASYVWRSSEGSNPKLYDKYEDFVSVLCLDCFAALPPRTEVTLDEIIGGAE